MARGKPDKRSHSKFQVREPDISASGLIPMDGAHVFVDPVLDPVVEPLVDVIDPPPVEEPRPLDPLAPVMVRNLGTRAWSGSDYSTFGGFVPAGGVGVVTQKKADQLVAGQHVGVGLDVGPFEIVEG